MVKTRMYPSAALRVTRRRTAALAALVGAALVGAACSGSPTAPDVLMSGRRVLTGSGGGTLCTPPQCEGFEGTVRVTAAGGTLFGTTEGEPLGGPASFTVFARDLKGTGRFETGFLNVSVEGDSALIGAIWYQSAGGIFEVTQKTVPATVEVTSVDTRECASGTRVTTTIVTTLENFGRTTIVETHCAP